MPADTREILLELDGLLSPARFEDYCVNGLQVPGAERVEVLATGVSANAELIGRAAAEGAQMLLVHHGLFWGSGVRVLDPLLRRRLALLLGADIALAAYHLPLDAHPELGNNALLARAAGAQALEPFARHGGEPIGFVGVLPGAGTPVEDLCALVGAELDCEPLLLRAGTDPVRRLAVVTGAGADHLQEAAAAGAQALLTGEPEERSAAIAQECGVHLIAAGHHATERAGVRALGEHLATRFGLHHVFIDVANPV